MQKASDLRPAGAEASVVQLVRQTTGLDGIASAVPEASPRYRNARISAVISARQIIPDALSLRGKRECPGPRESAPCRALQHPLYVGVECSLQAFAHRRGSMSAMTSDAKYLRDLSAMTSSTSNAAMCEPLSAYFQVPLAAIRCRSDRRTERARSSARRTTSLQSPSGPLLRSAPGV
jgi:hypothetical protein